MHKAKEYDTGDDTFHKILQKRCQSYIKNGNKSIRKDLEVKRLSQPYLAVSLGFKVNPFKFVFFPINSCSQ